MSDKVDRDCIAWSINDGMNSTWLYPDDLNYIEDGLKLLKLQYKDLAAKLFNSDMKGTARFIRNIRINNIDELIKLLGGDPDDYTLNDPEL